MKRWSLLFIIGIALGCSKPEAPKPISSPPPPKQTAVPDASKNSQGPLAPGDCLTGESGFSQVFHNNLSGTIYVWLTVKNTSQWPITGFEGELEAKNPFGDDVFHGHVEKYVPIESGKTWTTGLTTSTELHYDWNPYIREHLKLAKVPNDQLQKLEVVFTPTKVLFANGSVVSN